ncbi:MAG: trigger factor [Candidatus Portnoybacteria bacterium]|jgi:trigger factor|nr:trigger factor [Candidatus Portnoybacteria bacterium]
MKLEIKKLPHSEVELSFEINSKEWGSFIDEATRELGQGVALDGFRPGKAPKEKLVEKIGWGKILERAAELAVRRSYARALIDNRIEAVGQPRVHIQKAAPDNPFEFKAQVTVVPAVEMPDYRKIAKQEPLVKAADLEINTEEIDKSLDWLRQSRAKFVTVNRPSQEGDRVEIDFSVMKDGQPMEGGKSQNHPLVLGEKKFIPGFEDNLTELKEGEEKKFSLVFPSDYSQKDLAGQLADFEVKMKLVQARELPEINDEFARSLGKFADLAQLRQSIAGGLAEEKKIKAKDAWRAKVLNKISQKIKVDLPEILVKTEQERMLKELEISLEQMGLNLADYLKNIKKTENDLLAEWLPKAQERVLGALALEAIARQENIAVSDGEAEEEASKFLKHFSDMVKTEEQIDKKRLIEYHKGKLRNEKVFEFLENLA